MAQDLKMNGYSKLASLMGLHPELAIFRRFGALNARNLLYLQAELVDLENELDQCTKSDIESEDPNRKIYDRHWQTLSEADQQPTRNSDQLDLAKKMRALLKEYNETLLLQTLLANRDAPLSRDMSFLREWMGRPTMGFVYLLGADSDVYENPDFNDLIAVRHNRGQSLAMRVIGDSWVRFWRRLLRSNGKDTPKQNIYTNVISYSDQTLSRVGVLVGTMCASTLPILAIVSLYFVPSMSARLAAIAVFTCCFSGILGIFSDSRAIEIFAATAGFAAVQVVFIGTTSVDRAGALAHM